MQLHKLGIKNYKSLKNIAFINFDDITTIIGQNMSIIEFIEMMLTNNIPNELEYVMYLGYEENNGIK